MRSHPNPEQRRGAARVPRRWPWLAFCAALVLALASAASPNGFRKARRFGHDLSRMEAENTALAVENARLVREIENLRGSPAYLERVARDELGLVRPGEILFRIEEDP